MNMKMRRYTKAVQLASAIILLSAAGRVSAQQNSGDATNAPLRLEPTCRVSPVSSVCLQLDNGKIELLHVNGNVYMIAGAGANISLQIGDKSVLVVDTGTGQASDKVLAAIRALTDKPILFIVATGPDQDNVGGNATIAGAGSALPNAFGTDTSIVAAGLKMTSGAPIFAQFNALGRMSEAGVKEESLPTDTYDGDSWRFYNGESIYLYHASGHTDGDSIVLFRGSDVISTGDLYNPLISYPIVDKKKGGSIDGIVDGLNQIVELMVAKEDEEGGTYVIPGHGPISDRNDVVNYRDMVTILRARIAAMVKKGMTLEQVKAAKPTLDYDGIGNYAATKDAFIESVYQDLKDQKAKKLK